MIETLAKIFADTGGTAGLIVFGFFGVIIAAMLMVMYVALYILASVHDFKEKAFEDGLLKERRDTAYFRSQRHGWLTSISRRMRGKTPQ